MGSCWCKGTSTVHVVSGRRVSDSDSDMSNDPPFNQTIARAAMIDQYIIQMVQMVGSVSQSFDDQPAPLVKLHSIADNAEGWQSVIKALITAVPLSQPLGPSAITIIFDDCPLPAFDTVDNLLNKLALGRNRASTSHECEENKRYERNLLVILGCIAEKFAGDISGKFLTERVMEYLFTFLTDDRSPELILQALITLEKFAKTKINRSALQTYFSNQGDQLPLVALERYCTADDILWRQVGFCARWLLDNMFFVPGRPLSYTTVDMSDVNAMLDSNDITDFLKISPDGLEARCDAHTFESVRCTFQVNESSWYYEAEILTPGVMQIGWATKDTKFSTHDGYGIGDDHCSIAYDGCRRLLWFRAFPSKCDYMKPWSPGDILGCLIDISKQEAIFSINGVRLPVCRDIFKHINEGFHAAASFMCFQGAKFNFGRQPFRYAPLDRTFLTFNGSGSLSEEEKQVLPRWLRLERQQNSQNDLEEVCAICYDKKPNTILSPCRHKGFCRECALRITYCPMCRERVWHYTVVPL